MTILDKRGLPVTPGAAVATAMVARLSGSGLRTGVVQSANPDMGWAIVLLDDTKREVARRGDDLVVLKEKAQ